MHWPGPRALSTCLMAAAAVAIAAVLAAAQPPSSGQATGRFTVDGKSFSFAHAYAHLEQDRDGNDVLWILLTEKPVSAGQLAGRLRDVAASEQLNALAFALDARNTPSDWRWHHPALSIGCALCTDLQFTLSSRTRDEIAGTVFSAKPQSFQKQTYEFRAGFGAKIRRPSEDAVTTVAQKSALRKLQQRGLAFRPGDFMASASQPDAIQLFLDAGMKPDALEPGMTETVLLYISRTDCADAASDTRATADAVKVVSMLASAGADPNYRSPEGNVPLTAAFRCPAIADALLKAGARLTGPSPVKGETAGQYVMNGAIDFGRPEMVRVLIAHGFDVKRDGARLLEKARREPEIEKMLRAAGAGPSAPASGTAASEPAVKTPASGAARAAATARSPEQARLELARLKLAFTEEAFWDRLTAFDAAAALLFLDAGIAGGARRQPQNDTPLLFLTSAGCAAPDAAQKAAAAEIALALIARKANVDARDGNDTTPLIHASESCPSSVVRALLRAGASAAAKSRGGATPMMLAVLADREDNVRALLEGGYDVSGELASLLPLAAGKPGIESLLKQAASKKRH